MDAPLYPPARAYEEPRVSDAAFGVDSVAVADLLRSPAIRVILNEEIPGFEARTAIPQLQPHMTNFTLRSMTEFGMVPLEALPRIDARLKALPLSERPGL